MPSEAGREGMWLRDNSWDGSFTMSVCLDSARHVCIFEDGCVSLPWNRVVPLE